jgi:hypothetical protein
MSSLFRTRRLAAALLVAAPLAGGPLAAQSPRGVRPPARAAASAPAPGRRPAPRGAT